MNGTREVNVQNCASEMQTFTFSLRKRYNDNHTTQVNRGEKKIAQQTLE